jgi:hypothetical protein
MERSSLPPLKSAQDGIKGQFTCLRTCLYSKFSERANFLGIKTLMPKPKTKLLCSRMVLYFSLSKKSRNRLSVRVTI